MTNELQESMLQICYAYKFNKLRVKVNLTLTSNKYCQISKTNIRLSLGPLDFTRKLSWLGTKISNAKNMRQLAHGEKSIPAKIGSIRICAGNLLEIK